MSDDWSKFDQEFMFIMKGDPLSDKITVLRGAGLLATVLATGLVFSPTASAADQQNSAFALSATGLIKVNPIPAVNGDAGFRQDSVAEFATPDKSIQLKLLNAQAGDGHARASLADLRVDLSPVKALGLGKPLLTATAVESVCRSGKASSALADARLGDIKLDVAAPPNTAIKVPGVASVVLNKQTKNANGSLTVTAISINVNGIQTLDVASATCAAGHDDLPRPTSTPTAGPTAPTSTGKPSSPGTETGGDKGQGHDSGAGDRPDANGKAPKPTPVAAHLDVTG
jgi:hypothetical protein